MSFRCQGCNRTQPEGTSPNRTITKVRTVQDLITFDPREEIAEEKDFCNPCAYPYKVAEEERLAEKYKNVTIGSAVHV